MFNNKLVDWLFDDGISNFMTSDYVRNQFYEQVLQRTVKDKICVDIGFGTGLLSFLAIKHGAKHITAFEINYERYLLGKYLIEKLGFSDKIHLVNAKFETRLMPKGCDLVFHEIFCQELWGEGAFFAAYDHSLPILPSKCKTQYFLCELDEEQFVSLVSKDSSDVSLNQDFNSVPMDRDVRKQHTYDFYNRKLMWRSNYPEFKYVDTVTFDPKVEFPNSDIYKKEIQKFVDEFWDLQETRKIHTISNINHRLLSFYEHQQLVNKSVKIGEYEFDYLTNTSIITDTNGIQKTNLDRSKLYVDLNIDAKFFKDKITILLPITSIGYEELELVCTTLEDLMPKPESGIDRKFAKHGWDIPTKHSIFVNPITKNETLMHIRQYLDTGLTRFWYD